MTNGDTEAGALIPIGSSNRNQWHVAPGAVDLIRSRREVQPVTVEATPQTITFDLAETAIVVIDMQNDFCHPDGWLASIGVDIAPARWPIEPLAELLPILRGSDVPVIWLNWGNRPDLLNCSPTVLHVYNPDGRQTGLGGPIAPPGRNARVLEEGSWSAAVVDELEIAAGDIAISKYRMSGFWDTPLDSVLRNIGARTLLFAGVNLDQCVFATLIDASCAGYDCILLEDCTSTTSPAVCIEATLYNIRQCFGLVTTGKSLATGIAEGSR